MSADIEPTADLASAGLVARTLDGDAGISVHAHAHGPCANCGSPLQGEYCHRCGQFSHVHRAILHIVESRCSTITQSSRSIRISFMSLWSVLVEPVSSVHALAGLVPFLHVFMQLKETYQLGIAAAGWRTSALGFATTLAGVFYFLLVLLVTFH